jgi:hypothetical protein
MIPTACITPGDAVRDDREDVGGAVVTRPTTPHATVCLSLVQMCAGWPGTDSVSPGAFCEYLIVRRVLRTRMPRSC